MARFKAGDKILVNGILMTLGSWPDDDKGPFHASYTNPQGGMVQGTYWAGQVNLGGKPVHTSDTVDLVEQGDGVASTLGDIHEHLAELNAEIEAKLEKENAADAAKAAPAK